MEELTGREPVRRSSAAQRGQHVELPILQIMRAERTRAEAVQAPGQPANPREHLHRRKIEIRTFPSPGLDDGVDLIPLLAGHTRSLDGRRAAEIARRRTAIHVDALGCRHGGIRTRARRLARIVGLG